MNWDKYVFHEGKWNPELTGNSGHIKVFFSVRKWP